MCAAHSGMVRCFHSSPGPPHQKTGPDGDETHILARDPKKRLESRGPISRGVETEV